jgi:hypothetical protein
MPARRTHTSANRRAIAWPAYALVFCCLNPVLAQRRVGEIRVEAFDPTGLGVEASISLHSLGTQFQQTRMTGPDRPAVFRGVPLGSYLVEAARTDFQTWTRTVEVRSEIPVAIRADMQVGTAGASVVVRESSTLIDPQRTGDEFYLGSEEIETRRAALPSRGLLELIETMPGWLLEANGILHPRGAEYDVLNVSDGFPLADNRSPGFAVPPEAEDFEYIRASTAGYPAEYGRKLGGVVETVTRQPAGEGWHGRFTAQGGSSATAAGYAGVSWNHGPTSVSGEADAAATDRYLDPPVLANYTNHGSLSGASLRFEQDIGSRDHLTVAVRSRESHFEVPNEYVQEDAGQRQDRRVSETMGTAAWVRTVSSNTLLTVRFMGRDLGAELWSNWLSTPTIVAQDRGFREGYGNASVAHHHGRQEWKAGGEYSWASLNERFGFDVTDPSALDPLVPTRFRFAGTARSREAAVYIQDQIRLGAWTISAGLRYDYYRLLVRDSAWSPRLGVAWNLESLGLAFRASYDRAFEIPATENLLLSSSQEAQTLMPGTTGLPVPPSSGNFWQAGFTKTLGRLALIDGAAFRRSIRNFADDSLFLNTGVSFPISFANAEIEGVEGRLEIPAWRGISGFASYSNLSGIGYLPVTGGLFLEGGQALLGPGSFRISQDQRTTVQARARYQFHRVWIGAGYRYGSGLPVEFDEGAAVEAHDPAVVAHVDLAAGRVKPSWALDAAAGVELRFREPYRVRMQVDVTNLTDRLNVINFTGLFSGTAIAAPRVFSIRTSVVF